MKRPDISSLRKDYKLSTLHRKDLKKSPLKQFEKWLNEAIKVSIPEPNAMTLSTVSPEGTPSSRIVLLKDITSRGLTFYTDFSSQKAMDISTNPNVSILFFWIELERQVRIEGAVETIPDAVSDEYFNSRPVKSKISAWASNQSSVIPSRIFLQERVALFSERFQNNDIPRPSNWGGFHIVPVLFEFWQGREDRLHDRFRYLKKNNNWNIDRLSP